MVGGVRDEQPCVGTSQSTAVAGVPALLDDLEGDTRNVLLTLARSWVTLVTGEIRSRDAAADWVLDRLPDDHKPVMAWTRADYLADPAQELTGALHDAAACARYLVTQIDRLLDDVS